LKVFRKTWVRAAATFGSIPVGGGDGGQGQKRKVPRASERIRCSSLFTAEGGGAGEGVGGFGGSAALSWGELGRGMLRVLRKWLYGGGGEGPWGK